jgi:hypothetical protein
VPVDRPDASAPARLEGAPPTPSSSAAARLTRGPVHETAATAPGYPSGVSRSGLGRSGGSDGWKWWFRTGFCCGSFHLGGR